MGRYRKKPVEVEAVQLNWKNWNEVCDFLGEALLRENPTGALEASWGEVADSCGESGPFAIKLRVRTIHGQLALVTHGDWIVAEPAEGRFYPVKPEIFAETYEPVEFYVGDYGDGCL